MNQTTILQIKKTKIGDLYLCNLPLGSLSWIGLSAFLLWKSRQNRSK